MILMLGLLWCFDSSNSSWFSLCLTTWSLLLRFDVLLWVMIVFISCPAWWLSLNSVWLVRCWFPCFGMVFFRCIWSCSFGWFFFLLLMGFRWFRWWFSYGTLVCWCRIGAFSLGNFNIRTTYLFACGTLAPFCRHQLVLVWCTRQWHTYCAVVSEKG